MSSLVPGSRFNLVGNPFPCNIMTNDLHSINSGLISAAFYFWDDDASGGTGYSSADYAVRTLLGGTAGGGGNTPSDRISACQGFMVEALVPGSLVFNNGLRAGGAPTFFRTDEAYQKLWLTMDNGQLTNEVLIGMVPDATEERSTLYDAYKLTGNAHISLAVQKAGEDFAIAAFPPVSDGRAVPLTASVSETGMFTFRNKQEEALAGTSVFLEDRLLGTFTPFDQVGASYDAMVSPQDANGRFYLHFGSLVTDMVQQRSDALGAWAHEGTLWLSYGTTDCMARITVTDMAGRALIEGQKVRMTDGRCEVQLPSLAKGVVVIQLESPLGRSFTKVMLH
jgi:hypothetical protein